MPNLNDARATYASSLAFLSARTELPILLNERRLWGCGVEVGVKEGEFSEHLLHYWHGAHLISVDPWSEDAPEAYVDIANVPQSVQEHFLETTRSRLSRFAERSTIWRMTSVEASPRIAHHSLDFVYLDARHDYDSVLEDLEAWFDRVRPGGIMAGHDYLDGNFEAGIFGVRSAVDSFFRERGIPVHSTLLDEPWLTWMVQIPTPDVSALVPELPLAAPTRIPALGDGLGREQISNLQIRGADGVRSLKLSLDPEQLSQRLMLEHFARQEFYEADTSQLLATVLRPGDTFIDVGAHVGYFSMLAAALVGPTGRVVSFEPNPDNFMRLEANARLNGFQQVRALQAAAGDRNGTADFFVNADNDGGHALWDVARHDFNTQTRNKPDVRQVAIMRIDSALSEGERRPRAMKLDAEGAELDVLRGARKSLEEHPIPYVVCEINRFGMEQMGVTEVEMRAYMEELGYDTFAFLPGEHSLFRLEADQWVEGQDAFNVLFRHRSEEMAA